MFKKLLSNLAFNPSLIGLVSFYAKRMHRETAIRRTSTIILSLSLVLQVFAVVSPVQPTLASSSNDMITGGVSTRDQTLAYCNANTRDYKTILAYYGIACKDLANAPVVSVKSTDYSKKLYSMGHLAYGKAGETAVTIPGLSHDMYLRYLWSWDSGAASTYKAFKGTTSTGTTFFILFSCGNLTFVGMPKPVETKPTTPINPTTPTDVCTNVPGVQVKAEECDVCANTPGIQISTNDCDVCPNVSGVQTNTSACDVCPNVPGEQSSTTQCDACPTTPGEQATTSECDLCPAIDGIQTTAQCDVCPDAAGDQTSTSQCDVCPKVTGVQTSKDACDVCPNIAGEQSSLSQCDACPKITGVQSSANECDVCLNVSGEQTSSSQCDVCPKTTGVQSSTAECDLCPNVSGEQTETSQCDVCPDVAGSQSNKSECDVCPDVAGTQTDASQCKSCSKSQSNTDVKACLTFTKTVANVTQNKPDANGTTANAGDTLVYTLTTQNTGKSDIKDYSVNENISDVLDYADVLNLNGSTKNSDNIITWPAATIKAGDKLTKSFIVKVKDQLPATPASASDPGHYDMTMTNVYGNTVSVKLPPPTLGKTVEVATVTTLPNTGPGASVAVAFLITVFGGYFFARSRLIAKELDIVRADFGGAGSV